ncbi:alanine dehydrogenase [Blastococcus xanthinilyticus]|uniref:Alanine dehydrogenase n=1 Tax=Blastococcus xanthinilyticus TaxID=1564164 RepID=A0A5S5D0M7_9ACTN|nr:alanine dehydrogenase [Blastococcus xanthinilyticus]TYP89581.1 L-alanine dehydrogenase [Blastococcus xanthinilyticus]
MRVGVPKEVKDNEFRVALTPAGAHELVARGHDVHVETGAGVGSGLADEEYLGAGAKIHDADDVWAQSELVLKVKEPVASEYSRMRRGQTLFTFLHLAASRACTEALLDSGIDSIAYETVQRADRSLPLLAPMSEVAGRLAAQVGAYHLMRHSGGAGVLMGGVPGVAPAKVVVIGAGVSGLNATSIAVGMHADVELLDLDADRLRAADALYRGRVRTTSSNAYEIARAVAGADLVIGAVLVPGARAPRLVDNAQVAGMKPGSVLVDISIDQGGCFEDSRPTTHADPTYPVHGSLFYCVANMPGSVPSTSTRALTNATLRYVLALADKGTRRAVVEDPELAAGVSTVAGALVAGTVAEAHALPVAELGAVLPGASS